MSKLHYCMRVDVIGGGEGGSKNNVHWTLSVAMVKFRLSTFNKNMKTPLRIYRQISSQNIENLFQDILKQSKYILVYRSIF